MQRDEMVHVIARWDAAVVEYSNDVLEREGAAARGAPLATVLHSPTDPGEIAALERRIGHRLPASYRQFLKVSDGADASTEGLDSPGLGLLPCARVGWFADAEPDLPHLEPFEYAEGWHEPGCDPGDTELDWLSHAFVTGESSAFSNHLTHLLALSPLDEHTAVLLNPLVRDVDGEWQCVYFDTHDVPTGYRGFGAFLDSRTTLLAGRTARVERRDDEEFETVDDATLVRWLTTWGVAPPWFQRLVRSDAPPRRLVTVLAEQLRGSDGGRVLWQVTGMRGAAALELAHEAWASVDDIEAQERPTSQPISRKEMDVLRGFAWSTDEGVRAWVVETLANNVDRPLDARVVSSLAWLAPAFVVAFRQHPGARPLVDAMVALGHWLTPEERLAFARAKAADLLDATWRTANPEQIRDVLAAAVSGGPGMLPVLRGLRGAQGMPQWRVAAALASLGETDLDFLARHLPFTMAARIPELTPELREEHRRLRVAVLAAPEGATPGGPLELRLAGMEREAVAVLVRAMANEPPADLALELERERTVAAAAALVGLAEVDPHALRSLARLGDQRCVEGLAALLGHDDAEARRFAARGLRELGERASVARLVAAAGGDSDDEVAWIAAHAALVAGLDARALLERLEAAGGVAAQVVGYWRTLLDDLQR